MYKVGDRIKIRKDLKYGTIADRVEVAFNMLNYKGKYATITYIGKMFGVTYYHIDIDKEKWKWTAEMFEVSCLIYNNNTTILYRNGKKYKTTCLREDTFDKEKGLLLCLAKSIGFSYGDICEMVEKAKVQTKGKEN